MNKLDIIEYNLEKQTKKLSKVIEPKKKFETFIKQHKPEVFATAIGVVQGEVT